MDSPFLDKVRPFSLSQSRSHSEATISVSATRSERDTISLISSNIDDYENQSQPPLTRNPSLRDTSSNSLPPPGISPFGSHDSGDAYDTDNLSQNTMPSIALQSLPKATSRDAAIKLMTMKRPLLLRRHQTMISSRSEFMKTLESSDRDRVSQTLLTGSKNPSDFIPAGYIPNPLQECCQILPCSSFVPKANDTTKRITPETVVDVLEGKYKDQYDQLYIIDCRFPYEFEGGHIKSAVNVNTTNELEELLLQPAITDKRVLLIFHCEFSCERGPRMARHLRQQDRAANQAHYPALFYPEVYVMKGGYSDFFKENKSYCWPEAYIEMQDEKHSQELQAHMRTFEREFSRTASKGFLGTESNCKKTSLRSTSFSSSSPFLLTTASTSSSASASIPKSASESAVTIKWEKHSTVAAVTQTEGDNEKSRTVAAKGSVPSGATNAFSSVLLSIKGAALSGTGPSSLSLPTVTKKPILGLDTDGKLSVVYPSSSKSRTSALTCPSSSSPLFKDMTCTGSTGPSATVQTQVNPFFTGFRQTKPVLQDRPPIRKRRL
ncbi:cell division cycle- protein [Haplosporangium sp. Z 767]|nr:cell division cycle- protein [Haplosporangium sp. Z 767]